MQGILYVGETSCVIVCSEKFREQQVCPLLILWGGCCLWHGSIFVKDHWNMMLAMKAHHSWVWTLMLEAHTQAVHSSCPQHRRSSNLVMESHPRYILFWRLRKRVIHEVHLVVIVYWLRMCWRWSNAHNLESDSWKIYNSRETNVVVTFKTYSLVTRVWVSFGLLAILADFFGFLFMLRWMLRY